MKSIAQTVVARILFGPFVVIVAVLGIVDRARGGNRRQHTATFPEYLEAIREGMWFGVLLAAVISLAVILFSDGLGVPAQVLPLVAWLPLLGGYVGAAVGFHLGGKGPSPADRHVDES